LQFYGFAAYTLVFIVMPLRGGEILFPTAGKVSKSALNVYFE